MKNLVTSFDLESAFKALDEIDIPVVNGLKPNRLNLKENVKRIDRTSKLIEAYDLSSEEEVEQAAYDRGDEIAKAKLARIEKIVDLDAQSPDELLPSYVGKIIVQCPQCMTLFYKSKEDIVPSEEDETVVNVEEKCQHCGNTSGYTVIGKVEEEKIEEEQPEEKVEETTEVEIENDAGVDQESTEETIEAKTEEETELTPLDLDITESLNEEAEKVVAFLDCSGSWDPERISNYAKRAKKEEHASKIFFFSDHIYANIDSAIKGSITTAGPEIIAFAKANPETKVVIYTDDDMKYQKGEALFDGSIPNVKIIRIDLGESLNEEAEKVDTIEIEEVKEDATKAKEDDLTEVAIYQELLDKPFTDMIIKIAEDSKEEALEIIENIAAKINCEAGEILEKIENGKTILDIYKECNCKDDNCEIAETEDKIDETKANDTNEIEEDNIEANITAIEEAYDKLTKITSAKTAAEEEAKEQELSFADYLSDAFYYLNKIGYFDVAAATIEDVDEKVEKIKEYYYDNIGKRKHGKGVYRKPDGTLCAKELEVIDMSDEDTFMKRIRVRDFNKGADLKDNDGNDEIDESLKLTEAPDVTEADIEELFDSKEFKTPISDNEVEIYLHENAEDIELEAILDNIDDIQEESLNFHISNMLKESYKFLAADCFKSTKCTSVGNELIVEGIVTDKTNTKTKNVVFNLRPITKNLFECYDNTLPKKDKFRLKTNMAKVGTETSLITEGYKAYKINK